MQEYFGVEPSAVEGNDPEFMQILTRHIFGDLAHQGSLDARMRELVTLTCLTVCGATPQLGAHVGAALRVGCTPVEIREAVYQCAPFIGFPMTLNAIAAMNVVFRDQGIELPLPPQGTSLEEQRYSRGRSLQEPLYGARIADRYTWLPSPFDETVPRMLTELVFGDFGTRGGLPEQERELLLLVGLVALGDTPLQVSSHFTGARRAGNTEEQIVCALVHASAYIGIPRLFNALNVIKEARATP